MQSRIQREGKFVTFKNGKPIRQHVISIEALAELIRQTSDAVDVRSPSNINEAVRELRKYVKPDAYVDRGDEMDASNKGYRMQLEWFGGQLLSMIDSKSWFGINSWINCTDKFTRRSAAATMETGLA